MPDIINRDAAPEANVEPNVLTLITATRPATVGKYYDFVGGRIVKRPIAAITAGVAESLTLDSVADMVDMLGHVTEQSNKVICPALWRGDVPDAQGDAPPFRIVTELELARRLGRPIHAPELGGIHLIDGVPTAARLRRGVTASGWTLFEMDNPEGMQPEWCAWSTRQRLEFWEPLLPGCSTCERVELRGSSARVHLIGTPEAGATHVWLRLSNPEMLDTMRAHLSVQMVLQDRSFASPRHSRTTGAVIGTVQRSVFDLAVFIPGRLVFCARPELSPAMVAAGYEVLDAAVTVVNEGAGPLVISGLEMPDQIALAALRSRTGETLHYSSERGALSIRSRGTLTLDSEIESRGTVQPLRAWLAGMADGESLRCEAPFRFSSSEAAFVRRTGVDAGFVHDVGNATTYTLEMPSMASVTGEMADLLRLHTPPERIAEAIADSEQRQAERDDQNRARIIACETRGDRAEVVAEDGLQHLVAARVREELPRLAVQVFRRGGNGLFSVKPSYDFDLLDRDGNAITRQGYGINMVTAPWLTEQISARLQFMKTKYRRLTAINVPTDIIQMVLGDPGPDIKMLRGIIATPTMLPSGELVMARGYNEASGFWLDHDMTLAIPETPTMTDALLALETFRGLLVDFPFAEPVHEAVALSLMMSAVLRPAFPLMPATLIDAAGMNSGKSYLTELVGLLAHGRGQPVATWRDDKENEKQLDGLLRGGAPFIIFDNANKKVIGGDRLCSLLSELSVQFRLLGETVMLSVPTTGLIVIINGNHARIGADATRRFVTCYLVRNDADAVRQFSSDPKVALMADRGKYVAAVLTIARAFIQAGRPVQLDMQSYTAWARLVPSALVWLGLPSVIDTVVTAIDEDPAASSVATVVELIIETMGHSRNFTVKEFVQAVMQRGHEAGLLLATACGATARGIAGVLDHSTLGAALGNYLRDHLRDTVVALTNAGGRQSWKLVKARGGTPGHAVVWCLVRVDERRVG